MEDHLHIDLDIYSKVDPTRTTVLRNAFANQMNRRFIELIKVIYEAIVEQDCFGYKKDIQALQMKAPQYQAFSYATSGEKVEAFMKWLQEQVNNGMLTTSQMRQLGSAINQLWTDVYIFDSYKRGAIRARIEMRKAGYDVPDIEDSGINSIFGMPMHLDRIGLLYLRVYTELKGITDTMSQIIARVLAQGIADGDSPRLLARKLVASINGEGIGELGLTDTLGRYISPMRRAELLARTEIIRAHHVATIQEYRNWGVEGVYVLAELKTAGDDRVCDKCMSLEGKTYTLDEAEGVIPVHPLCRCIMLPKLIETKN